MGEKFYRLISYVILYMKLIYQNFYPIFTPQLNTL